MNRKYLKYSLISSTLSLPLPIVVSAGCVKNNNSYIEFKKDISEIKYNKDYILNVEDETLSNKLFTKEINDIKKVKNNLELNESTLNDIDNRIPTLPVKGSFTSEYLWARHLIKFEWRENSKFKDKYQIIITKNNGVFDNTNNTKITYKIVKTDNKGHFIFEDTRTIEITGFISYGIDHNHLGSETKNNSLTKNYIYNLSKTNQEYRPKK
ncbi:hypothetical protein [Mycoplasmopsis lipofaciens]|uniref:hypothetical protein n=1 Tax=Mycoplasmopsis lipofaciens TaxID=114884 RepID=UPI00048608FE|nr:hypothetical protein [Mycoplasmopsis lipofaciens]